MADEGSWPSFFVVKNEATYLYSIRLDGSKDQLKAFPGPQSVYGISLSPDGSWLLIRSSFLHTICCTVPGGIGVIKTDGTGLIWLTGPDYYIFWTLDGKQLIGQKSGDGSVYIIDPASGKAEKTDWLKWLQTSPPPYPWLLQPGP